MDARPVFVYVQNYKVHTALYIGTVDGGVVSPVYNEESTMLNILIITCNFRGGGGTLRWYEVQKFSHWGEGLWADQIRSKKITSIPPDLTSGEHLE